MDEDPEVDDLPEFFESDDVVLVPLFIADGYHTQEDIPEDVGLCEDHTEGYDVPLRSTAPGSGTRARSAPNP